MGRKRTISRDELMSAIERVARRVGAAGLSIDAVAKEAGISKSSVVYDCESKAGLLAAFIRHKMAQHREVFAEIQARHEGKPNTMLLTLIDKCRRVPTEEELEIALLISASMGEHAECREIMREVISGDIQAVAEQAGDRKRMLMTLLALHGMAFLEFFGFSRFDQETRDDILDELMAIAESDPGANGD
ncbi:MULTISPECIES: TetR/AcrR family transcriptional regulator [Paracoccus]|uniref:TetR family transcriptional regulator n=2 Tax=Paracoccaceae TaxID=31989 RepID=A0AAD3NYX0_9RHOB|nr:MULTISPECIES: TetR family transcriptional regulator [Paracoccus]GLK64206.1 TetR family transcriptional regulator [Paracoccus kondratievae]SMG45726.1 transcriptional regulator, TetR family [Paracoccus sp. J56]